MVYPPNNKKRRGRAARGDLLDLADAVELDRAGAGSDDVEAVALGALGEDDLVRLEALLDHGVDEPVDLVDREALEEEELAHDAGDEGVVGLAAGIVVADDRRRRVVLRDARAVRLRRRERRLEARHGGRQPNVTGPRLAEPKQRGGISSRCVKFTLTFGVPFKDSY